MRYNLEQVNCERSKISILMSLSSQIPIKGELSSYVMGKPKFMKQITLELTMVTL